MSFLGSDSSLTDSCQLFEAMLPNSEFANTMELGGNNLKYIVNFGLGPYLKDSSNKNESSNKEVQKCEMGLVICSLNSTWNKVHDYF